MAAGLAEKVKPPGNPGTSGRCGGGTSCGCGCSGPSAGKPERSSCPGTGSCSCGCKTKKPGGAAAHPPVHPRRSRAVLDPENGSARRTTAGVADILARLEMPAVRTPSQNTICCLPPHRELRPRYSCWPCAQYLLTRGRAGDWPFVAEPPQAALLRAPDEFAALRDRPVLEPARGVVPEVATAEDGVAVCGRPGVAVRSAQWSRAPHCIDDHDLPDGASKAPSPALPDFRGKGGGAGLLCRCRCDCPPDYRFDAPHFPLPPGPDSSRSEQGREQGREPFDVVANPDDAPAPVPTPVPPGWPFPPNPGADPETGAALVVPSGPRPFPDFPFPPYPGPAGGPAAPSIVVAPDSPSESNWEQCPSCGLPRLRIEGEHRASGQRDGTRSSPAPPLGTRSFGSPRPPLEPPLHGAAAGRPVRTAGNVGRAR